MNLDVSGIASVQNVELRNMHFDIQETHLDRHHMSAAPKTVTLAADATVVLRYRLANNVAVNNTVVEKKYFGESVSGGIEPHRISVAGGAKTLYINNVSVPSGYSEAILRLTVSLYPDEDDKVGGHLSLDSITVNGTAIEAPIDWKGPKANRAERFFGVLDIPVPVELLQSTNTIAVDFRHNGELTVANLIVSEFTSEPNR